MVGIFTIQPISVLELVIWGSVDSLLSFILLVVAGWVHLYIYLQTAMPVPRYHQRWRNTSFTFREGTEDRYCRERKKKLSLVVLCRLPI